MNSYEPLSRGFPNYSQGMLCLKTTFVVLIFACMMQQFMQAEARKGQQEKKGRERGKQDAVSPKPTLPSQSENQKKPRKNAARKGSFSTKDKTQCSWEAAGDQTLVLSISCTGKENVQCEYTANPTKCPQYESSSGKFWKQIARALKKQKKLCQDPKALIKAAVCKNVPKEAHFSLRTPQEPSKKDCKGPSDRNKLAEEYCTSTWSSLCAFLFAMVMQMSPVPALNREKLPGRQTGSGTQPKHMKQQRQMGTGWAVALQQTTKFGQ
ncbi:hypothetical protein NFI96_001950 [Prochilodus magdalenae]|nr:hypothetical protein NFI96_001950 [Prochilodus magdalenae]